jgi:GTPase Era involved in 16S rRNA processing
MDMPKEFSMIEYKKTLFGLINFLRQLRDFAERLNIQSLVNSIDDTLHRVETNAFSIAVVGEFKRGKSTFINALLGKEILPSDILPTTATLNRVTYGLKPLVKIQFKDGSEEIIDLEDLSNYITKLTPESEAIATTIQEAIVYYPVPYCQNNVDIIDTPGLSDDENMTAITLSVLPYVDVAILVVMALSPLSESERDFLENHLLNEDLGRILFVVTGIDRCNSPEDIEKIVANVENRIKTYLLSGTEKRYGKESDKYKACVSRIVQPKVFPISAYQALQAKQKHDPELMAASRFNEFEIVLETFLTEERGIILLQVPLNRVISASREILASASVSTIALQQKQMDLQTKYEQEVENLNTQKNNELEVQQQYSKKIDQILRATQFACNQIELEIKQAANHAIDTAMITSHDFNQSVLFDRMFKFDGKVSEALMICSRRLAGKLQIEFQRELSALPSDLKPSEDSIRDLIKSIGIQFVALAESLIKMIREERIAVQTSINMKGSGGWLGNTLRNNDAVKIFKDNYKNTINNEVSQQLRINKVASSMELEFRTLLEYTKPKVGGLIQQPQNATMELQVKFARDEAQMQMQSQELERITSQTQNILNSAQDRLVQLTNLMNKDFTHHPRTL